MIILAQLIHRLANNFITVILVLFTLSDMKTFYFFGTILQKHA